MPPVEMVEPPASQMGVPAPTHRLSDYGGARPTAAAPATADIEMVTLVAPNGVTKSVPKSQEDHYLSLGARRA